MNCRWCNKSLAGDFTETEIACCGSCALRPISELVNPDEDPDPMDPNHDLSYLRPTVQKTRSKDKVLSTLRELQPATQAESKPMRKLRLKSNSLRDTIHPIGSLMLKFDGSGIAEFPEVYLAEVRKHMDLRPGRFKVLDTPHAEVSILDKVESTRAALEAFKAVQAEVEPFEPEFVKEPEVVLELQEEAPKPVAQASTPRKRGRPRKTPTKGFD